MSSRREHREKFWNNHEISEYTCPECNRGIDEISVFHVHHIDGDSSNGNLSNLKAYCRYCHMNLHGEWTRIYSSTYDRKFAGIFQ